MSSAYWSEIDNDGYERKVRECKNDGCKQIVYYDEGVGRFIEFNTGEVHDCKFYKRNSQGPRSSSSGSSSKPATTAPPPAAAANNTISTQKLEEYGLIQVETLKRHTDLLERQKEDNDLIGQYLRVISETIVKQNEILDLILNKLTGETEETEAEGKGKGKGKEESK